MSKESIVPLFLRPYVIVASAVIVLVLAILQSILGRVLSRGDLGPTPEVLIWAPLGLWVFFTMTVFAFLLYAINHTTKLVACLYLALLSAAIVGTWIAWGISNNYVHTI